MSAWEKRVGSQAKKKNNQRVTYNISLDDLEVKKSMPPGVCQPQCAQIISDGAFISTPGCWRSLLFFLKDQDSFTATQKERYQNQIIQNFGTIWHKEFYSCNQITTAWILISRQNLCLLLKY